MATAITPLSAPVEAADALRRIAFLLERERAGTYRVEAFRRAVGVVRATDPAELASRAEAGTLQDLTGIGKSTAAVIEEALGGELPAYLRTLQDKAATPLTDGGEDLARRCGATCTRTPTGPTAAAPSSEMVLTAAELGHDYLVLTDHSPRLKVANGLSSERLTRQLKVVEQVNATLGGRSDCSRASRSTSSTTGRSTRSQEMLDQLDVVVASVHSKLRMNAGPMTRRMVAAARNPRVNILGHCTGRLVTGSRGQRPQSEFDARAVFAACAEHDVAVEINSRPERLTRRTISWRSRSRSAASSPSTPTRTRPDSSTSRRSGASGPSASACRPSASSTPGMPTAS